MMSQDTIHPNRNGGLQLKLYRYRLFTKTVHLVYPSGGLLMSSLFRPYNGFHVLSSISGAHRRLGESEWGELLLRRRRRLRPETLRSHAVPPAYHNEREVDDMEMFGVSVNLKYHC